MCVQHRWQKTVFVSTLTVLIGNGDRRKTVCSRQSFYSYPDQESNSIRLLSTWFNKNWHAYFRALAQPAFQIGLSAIVFSSGVCTEGALEAPPIFHTDASNRTVGSFSFRASRVQSRYDAYLGAQPPLYMLNRCRDSLCLSLLQLTVVTFGYGSSSCLLPISCSGFCTAAATALHVMISVGLATRDMSKET